MAVNDKLLLKHPVIISNKKHLSKQAVTIAHPLGKKFFVPLLLLKACESFLFRQSTDKVRKLVLCLVCMSVLWIFRENKTK